MNWLSGKQNPSVLIVEDDPVAALLLERIFRKHGVQVDTIDNAELALKLHGKNQYRLIISDWTLPGCSGVELCSQVRKLSGDYVYFVVCTSRRQRNDRLQAFEAGVDDFITKPIDREELEARVTVASRLIQNRELLQAKSEQLERAADRLVNVNLSLQTASRRFEELFNGLPVACFTFDESGRVHEWNRFAVDAFGIESHEAFEQKVWELFNPADPDIWSPQIVHRLFQGENIRPFDWSVVDRSGHSRFYAGHLICLRNASGHPVAAMCANLDVTDRKTASHKIEKFVEQLSDQKRELEKMNARLGHLALTDGLTGLWNHRRFQEMLDDTIQFHRVREIPFSLVLLDIDHFKKFNDDFGHQFGDQVLRQFADALKTSSRVGEMCSRYGGEEFAILLQGCGVSEALVTVDRFRTSIKSQVWEHRDVTASLGVSTFTNWEMTGADLIRQADEALYASKAAGRDCVTHFDHRRQPVFKCA
jgi:two-component system cell cycle response regulator